MKTVRTDHLPVRICVSLAGMFILAMGIAVSTRSGIGISPLNAISFVISEITHTKMGYITILMYFVYILIEACIKGKDFRAVDFLQVVLAVIFGMFVNITRSMVSWFVPADYAMRIACTLISAFLIACGTGIYVSAKLIPQATEGLIIAVCERWKLKFADVKNAMDMISVLLAVLISLTFLHTIIGVREGTIITALLVGRILKRIRPFTERLEKKLDGEK